ncbi:ABC transporter ATP-binding protein, partial [Verrucosispora sp. SN26_14.1]
VTPPAAAPTDGGGGMSAAEARQARKELTRLERQVGKLEQKEAALLDQLAANATDYSKVAELDAQLGQVRAEREQVEEAWLALADEIPAG